MPCATVRAGRRGAGGAIAVALLALHVGLVFCGRQSPGGHNVASGLLSALRAHNPGSTLVGFRRGTQGLFEQDHTPLGDAAVAAYDMEFNNND